MLQEAHTGTLEIPGGASPLLKIVASPFLTLTALTPVGFRGGLGPPGAAGAGAGGCTVGEKGLAVGALGGVHTPGFGAEDGATRKAQNYKKFTQKF
jgi:hypothetical protein